MPLIAGFGMLIHTKSRRTSLQTPQELPQNHLISQCCPKRFSIKTKKGSKAKVEITTLAKSTTSFTSYGKYNTFRTSNR